MCPEISKKTGPFIIFRQLDEWMAVRDVFIHTTVSIFFRLKSGPEHTVVNMPALSPTMV